jgi:predicted dehydrogenase
MLDKEQLDALFVLTPPTVRLEPIEMACDRKIAVFCEKPPAMQLEEGIRITDMLDTAGIINSVGFMYRWYKSVDRLRELLLGQTISCVNSRFLCDVALNPSQPKWTFIQERAGGPLLEQAIHSLDLLRYLVGDIVHIAALGGNPVLPKSEAFTIEDSHALSLRFATDSVGVHLHSWVHHEAVVKITIFGSDSELSLDLIPPGSLIGNINGGEVIFQPEVDDPYATQISQFIEAVEKQDQSIIRSPYRDAHESLRVTLAAIKSISSFANKWS